MSTTRLPILNEIARKASASVAGEAALHTEEAALHTEEAALHTEEAVLHTEDEEWMHVGDLAREAGKTVRAIHLYEQMELLKPAGRSKGRYRLYGPEALVRIRWIGKLQDLGFSLTDIKTIMKDVEAEGRASSASSAMVKIREVYRSKLDATRAQIERLRTLEREILESLEYLETCGSACEPDSLLATCSSCCHHDRDEHVPDLVLGFRS